MSAREAIVSAWIFILWITFYEAQSDTYRRPSSPWFQREDGITCTPGNQSGCASGECCVKEWLGLCAATNLPSVASVDMLETAVGLSHYWGYGGDTCQVLENKREDLVLTFNDLDRNMVVSTRCRPLLTLGELCLRRAEGYLCDCQKGLHCVFSRNESYGHCSPET